MTLRNVHGLGGSCPGLAQFALRHHLPLTALLPPAALAPPFSPQVLVEGDKKANTDGKNKCNTEGVAEPGEAKGPPPPGGAEGVRGRPAAAPARARPALRIPHASRRCCFGLPGSTAHDASNARLQMPGAALLRWQPPSPACTPLPNLSLPRSPQPPPTTPNTPPQTTSITSPTTSS
jgi:hypothetical protein